MRKKQVKGEPDIVNAQIDEPTSRKSLRLWPGVLAAVLLLLVRLSSLSSCPGTLYFGVISGMVGGLAIVVWWVFFSRAPWAERLGAIVLMLVAMFTTSRLLQVSIATGAMGMLFLAESVEVINGSPSASSHPSSSNTKRAL